MNKEELSLLVKELRGYGADRAPDDIKFLRFDIPNVLVSLESRAEQAEAKLQAAEAVCEAANKCRFHLPDHMWESEDYENMERLDNELETWRKLRAQHAAEEKPQLRDEGK